MTALRGLVSHGPLRAKHFDNFHQAQPLDEGVDPGSIAQIRLERQPPPRAPAPQARRHDSVPLQD